MRNVGECVSPHSKVLWSTTPILLTSLLRDAEQSLRNLSVWREAKLLCSRAWKTAGHAVMRIAVWRIPQIYALALTFAAPHIDAVPVWLNDRWSAKEASEALMDALPHLVIVGTPSDYDELSHAVSEAAAFCICPSIKLQAAVDTDVCDSCDDGQIMSEIFYWDVLNGGKGSETPSHSSVRLISERNDEDLSWSLSKSIPYAIFYSSGTTGKPKGVLISHSAMLVQARAKLVHVGYDLSTRYLHLAPLFHIGGASSAVAVALAGGLHVTLPNLQDAAVWLRAVSQYRINTLVVVPAMLQMMVDIAPASRKEKIVGDALDRSLSGKGTTDLSCVDTLLCGGGTLSPSLQATAKRRLFSSARFLGAYGMTEATSSMTFLDYSTVHHESPEILSVGLPPAHVELEVREIRESFNNRDGTLVGEVVTRGPHVMDGYFRHTAESFRVVDFNGWLGTGDLGYIGKDGYLFLAGRLKDMIKTGGENVFAGEVEATLAQYPGLHSTAVVGVPHRVLGEAVAAAVIVAQNWQGESSLMAWCREHLSHFKVPKWIVPMKSFPSNLVGKVRKDELREEVIRRIRSRAKL